MCSKHMSLTVNIYMVTTHFKYKTDYNLNGYTKGNMIFQVIIK